jgi:ABC-2 type transport system ATP-binding protein
VWFRYGRGGAWVLQGVTATLEPGQVVVVGGRNGAGKSTLLQLVAGVLAPVRGAVVERPTRVGWVPERFPALQPFTVDRYLMAMGALAGLDVDERVKAVDMWADLLGISSFLGTRLASLSKGTAQKVGLAQAMLVTPDLLILDEPWEGLDAATRELVPEIVSEVQKAGGSVLVSDHLGETARLPGAASWTVADANVRSTEAEEHWVIEVAVPARSGPRALAELEAAGHDIVRVRR